MKTIPAALALLDISGYTRFINYHSTSLVHAEDIITQLLEAVIDAAEFPLVLNKLEGDAVFLYTDASNADPKAVARDVQEQVSRLFEAFRAKQNSLVESGLNGCPCDACSNVHILRLKAILHWGEVVVKQIRQFTELAGNEVILIHRLLKNSVTMPEYVMLTEAFREHSGGLDWQGGETRTETVEGLGTVRVQVYPAMYRTAAVSERNVELMTPEMMKGAESSYWWKRLGRVLRGGRVFRNLPG
jgi:class 3 adenylate cyclase